jgi:DHA1 family bicyclomycin/chloramphenicol resistance-like MFS transporter
MKSSKLELYLLSTSSLISGFSQFSYNALLPQVQEQLHTSIYWVNMTVTVPTLAMALMQIVFGSMADRQGRRRALLIGMILFVIGSIGASFANSIVILLIFRTIQGIGASAIPVVAAAMISDLFEGRERTKAMELYQLILALTPAVGPMIGGVLGGQFGYVSIFYFLAIMGAILLTANWFWLKESRPESAAVTKISINTYKMFLVHPKSRALLLLGVKQALASSAVLVFIPIIFHSQFGTTPETTGIAFLLLALSFVISMKFAGKLEKKWGSEKIFIIGCWLNVFSLLLFIGIEMISLPMAFVLVCIFGATYGMAMPPPLTILAGLFSEERATAIALYNLCRFVGMAVGPMLGAFLYTSGSAFLLYFINMLLYGIGIVISQHLLFQKKKLFKEEVNINQ